MKTTRFLRERKKIIPLLGLLLVWSCSVQAQYHANLDQSNAQEAAWVDSVFNTLTPDQRLGQLFMIRAHSDLGPSHVAEVEQLIKTYQVSGLCFFQGTPAEQVRLLNRYQALSPVPLMVAIDGEWGLNMRMKDSVMGFPRQLMLGAIRDNHLIYEMGEEIARQMQRVGVNVNFAPVVDVNNNPNNPVIGTRSFGEDRINVAIKGVNYMKGMQDHGIVACAKHFPGHGDTDVDSHLDLPLISHDRRRLDSIEMYPFRALIDQGVGSIMIAHLQVPALEPRPNYPTSVSPYTINKLLREELGFHGLTFTDGLEMKGVTKHFSNGAVEAEALLAGNDILLLPESVPQAIEKITAYLADGRLTEQDVNRRVKRVLRAKYRMGLTVYQPRIVTNIQNDINNPAAAVLREKLIENALTLVRNEGNVLPIQQIQGVNLAALAFGAGSQPAFQDRLLDYAPVDLLRTDYNLTATEQDQLLGRLAKEDLVIVSLHGMGRSAQNNFGISSAVIGFLEKLQAQSKVVLVIFGNPYSLKLFDSQEVVLEAYEENDLTEDKAAQALFGAIGLNGRLPVTASPRSPFNAGVTTRRNFRMGYGLPERVDMDGDTLRYYVRKIANEAIKAGATPGCVVLVARHGQVVLEEAFGNQVYDGSQKVRTNDIYDLASITKVAATTLAIMDLVQTRQLDLDQTLGQYLPELKGTNKDQLSIREVLAHCAALKPWIPFYTSTLDAKGSRSREIYHGQADGAYSVQVSPNIYMDETYLDSIWQAIDQSDLRANQNYRYSDLGFYYLARLVKRISGKDLDAYVQDRFYEPLGLFNIGFRPYQHFSMARIPPTEIDKYWRQQKVQGYVHDMGAAMLGGVSGHAGLFSDIHDLAVLGQLFLQRGIYGNQVFLKPDVVREFTSRFVGSTRRGLGFDMKELATNRSQNTAPAASNRAFGHQGFTGTCFWADPAEELLFVFLSNRTYPSMNNNKLSRLNIRTRLQAAAYQSITYHDQELPVVPFEPSALPKRIDSAPQ